MSAGVGPKREGIGGGVSLRDVGGGIGESKLAEEEVSY